MREGRGLSVVVSPEIEDTKKLSVSVVVPARNEARNLPWVLARLPDQYEVVLVDGHSSDGTAEVARSLRPEAVVLSQLGRGKGDAIVCGVHACTGDIVVTLDADGSADPAEIPRFVRAIEAGADLAKGSRHLAGGGSADLTATRRCGNAALNRLVNSFFGTAYTDLCYGMNAFRRDRAADLGLSGPIDPRRATSRRTRRQVPLGHGFEIETLMNIRAAVSTLVVTEVPSFERSRMYGRSNLNTVRDGFRVLQVIVTERRGSRAVPAAAMLPAGTRETEAPATVTIAAAGTPDDVRKAMKWTEVIDLTALDEPAAGGTLAVGTPSLADAIRLPGELRPRVVDLSSGTVELPLADVRLATATPAGDLLLEAVLGKPAVTETDEVELPA